ncbi:neurogenic differentiation factor 1 [Anopheles cruzii]|uniref:neurogenic differentiation factor 1 n=1 Tax=Anopheles cruzii TaxID=68878 RepID=UPI0022EC21DC|nr:neurogenic differentiation factor 1 [Anopheles cruzii]
MPKRKRAPSPKFDLLEDGFDDDLSSNDDKPGTPIQRNAANARERARMRVLSKAFFNLKRNIPWVPADTKLSKLDTLRLAKNYINYLAATLDGQSVEDFSSNLAQPPKTAWPFIFQQVQPHVEPSKSAKNPSAFAAPTTSPAAGPNVGQTTCSAADQKWKDYRLKEGTCRGPSSGPEDIGSHNVKSPHHPPPAAAMHGFSESTPSGGMEGVNDYGGYGEPMISSYHQHQQHHQQSGLQQQDHHHQLHQHYQGTVQSHTDGCHLGVGISVATSYQRHHMTSIGGD